MYDLIGEAMLVGSHSYGGITISDLRELRWPEYDVLVQELKKRAKDSDG